MAFGGSIGVTGLRYCPATELAILLRPLINGQNTEA